MRLLLVGDPHATPDSLEECGKLMEFVQQTATLREVDSVVILGDLHHCHALVRVEVTHFWRGWLERLEDAIVLVGNHDMPGNASGDPLINALVSYEGIDHLLVADRPAQRDGITFMPYCFDPKKFVEDANANPSEILICHQTFCGAKYENNFPAADGVDPDLIKAPLIISGHIHMQQRLGDKVIYVGSPRWMTVSDANQERGIHIFDSETKELEFISTAKVCRPIRSHTVTPETENDPVTVDEFARTIVTFRGPKEWVAKKIEGLGAMAERLEIRSVYVEDKAPEIRESDGLAESLEQYVCSREWTAPKDEVWSVVRSRVSWFKK